MTGEKKPLLNPYAAVDLEVTAKYETMRHAALCGKGGRSDWRRDMTPTF